MTIADLCLSLNTPIHSLATQTPFWVLSALVVETVLVAFCGLLARLDHPTERARWRRIVVRLVVAGLCVDGVVLWIGLGTNLRPWR